MIQLGSLICVALHLHAPHVMQRERTPFMSVVDRGTIRIDGDMVDELKREIKRSKMDLDRSTKELKIMEERGLHMARVSVQSKAEGLGRQLKAQKALLLQLETNLKKSQELEQVHQKAAERERMHQQELDELLRQLDAQANQAAVDVPPPNLSPPGSSLPQLSWGATPRPSREAQFKSHGDVLLEERRRLVKNTPSSVGLLGLTTSTCEPTINSTIINNGPATVMINASTCSSASRPAQRASWPSPKLKQPHSYLPAQALTGAAADTAAATAEQHASSTQQVPGRPSTRGHLTARLRGEASLFKGRLSELLQEFSDFARAPEPPAPEPPAPEPLAPEPPLRELMKYRQQGQQKWVTETLNRQRSVREANERKRRQEAPPE